MRQGARRPILRSRKPLGGKAISTATPLSLNGRSPTSQSLAFRSLAIPPILAALVTGARDETTFPARKQAGNSAETGRKR